MPYKSPYEIALEEQSRVTAVQQAPVERPLSFYDQQNLEPTNQMYTKTGLLKTPGTTDEKTISNHLQYQYNENKKSVDEDEAIDKEANESYANYVKSLADFTTPPVSQEDIQKREKATYTKAGIGALGNVLNSFSNLLFTGNGAPSQTLPNNPDAHTAVKEMNALNDQRAQQYLNAQGARFNAAMARQSARDARRATASKLQNDMIKLQLEMQKAEREGRLTEAKILSENYKAVENQYNALIKGVEAQYAPEKQASEIGKNKASSAASYANANRASKQGAYYDAQTNSINEKSAQEREKNSITIPIGGGDYAQMPKNAQNAMVLADIVRTFGNEDGLRIVGTVEDPILGVKSTDRERKIEEMASYIGSHLNDNTEGARAAREKLRKLGGVKTPVNPLAKPKEGEQEQTDW